MQVRNKSEWLSTKIFTEQEIDNANKKTGRIGMRYGEECYVSTYVPTN